MTPIKKLSLENAKQLTRSEMKNIFAGSGGDGPCSVTCNNGDQISVQGLDCGPLSTFCNSRGGVVMCTC